MLNSPLVAYALVGLVAVLIGRWLYKKDTEVEDRRRAAAQLAGVYRSAGLIHTAEFLEDYSVGDYSGMAKKIKKAADLLNSKEAGEKVLKDLLARIAEAGKKPE